MAIEPNQTPQTARQPLKPSILDENGENKDTLFTPRFRSVAAMAGWDEEALILATLVVEDTPDRESKHKKRVNSQFKSPPTGSRRSKRIQRRNSPVSMPMVVLDLGDEKIVGDEERKEETATSETKENVVEGSREVVTERKVEEINANGIKVSALGGIEEVTEKKKDPKTSVVTENVLRGEDPKKIKSKAKGTLVEEGTGESLTGQNSSDPKLISALPCMDKLREELSCAICLDICFEPSTTSCGHSFCKICLKSAADKCGKKCPKCRQLISNGRSCQVNTVLWNTIQLLFPQEIEQRKEAAEATKSRAPTRSKSQEQEISEIIIQSTRVRAPLVARREVTNGRRRRGGLPSQDEDAALALRLQREEYMVVGRGSEVQHSATFVSAREHLSRASFSSARENLRAMASRAVNLRVRRA